jgi:hypothetical protein
MQLADEFTVAEGVDTPVTEVADQQVPVADLQGPPFAGGGRVTVPPWRFQLMNQPPGPPLELSGGLPKAPVLSCRTAAPLMR